ncbi:MAG: TIGR02206 family membrane protein [Chloroflexota bacterium]
MNYDLQFLNLPNPFAALGLIGVNHWLARFKYADEATKRLVRYLLVIGLWVDEIIWHYWNYTQGQWTIQTMLPLHSCSLMIWLAGFMLLFKNYHIYEFGYFLGLGGATQILLTSYVPLDLLTQYRYFQVFISHGLLITSVLYMTTVEGFRPTWGSLLRVIIGTNLYMAMIFPLNLAIGSNYMFLAYKPEEFASILDILPAWPYYILYLEALGILVFLLLYLPFAIKDWRAKVNK